MTPVLLPYPPHSGGRHFCRTLNVSLHPFFFFFVLIFFTGRSYFTMDPVLFRKKTALTSRWTPTQNPSLHSLAVWLWKSFPLSGLCFLTVKQEPLPTSCLIVRIQWEHIHKIPSMHLQCSRCSINGSASVLLCIQVYLSGTSLQPSLFQIAPPHQPLFQNYTCPWP